jgi:hypothetical protein
MSRDFALPLVFIVGILLSFIDMVYQRHTAGGVDQRAAFRWFWRTLIAAVLFFLVFGIYQAVFSS